MTSSIESDQVHELASVGQYQDMLPTHGHTYGKASSDGRNSNQVESEYREKLRAHWFASPDGTLIDAPLSSSLDDGFTDCTHSSHPRSNCASPHTGFPAVSAFDSLASQHIPAFTPSCRRWPGAFNISDVITNCSRYSDCPSYIPDTVPLRPAYDELLQLQASTSEPGNSDCVLPALLYSSRSNVPISTPRTTLPAFSTSYSTAFHRYSANSTSTVAVEGDPAATKSTSYGSTTVSRPAPSLFLSKPFYCPKPNCNKRYREPNGLKYHRIHGTCNFAPPKDVKQVQALLASKWSQCQGTKADGEYVEPSFGGISESELREVEREAERLLRPFACGIAECKRRYKNKNGLIYHYRHSSDHGAIGLALLASGRHECLQHTRGKPDHRSKHSTPGRNINVQQQQHRFQMRNRIQPSQTTNNSELIWEIQLQHSGNIISASMPTLGAEKYKPKDAHISR
jgi:transcription factor SFP1